MVRQARQDDAKANGRGAAGADERLDGQRRGAHATYTNATMQRFSAPMPRSTPSRSWLARSNAPNARARAHLLHGMACFICCCCSVARGCMLHVAQVERRLPCHAILRSPRRASVKSLAEINRLLKQVPDPTRTHARTLARSHARTHAHTLARTHARTNTRTHTRTHAQSRAARVYAQFRAPVSPVAVCVRSCV